MKARVPNCLGGAAYCVLSPAARRARRHVVQVRFVNPGKYTLAWQPTPSEPVDKNRNHLASHQCWEIGNAREDNAE